MERLTKRTAGITGLTGCFDECDHANSGCDCVRIRSALRRLSAYEDTGLTPEQVAELAGKNTPKAVRCNTAEERTEVQKGVVFGKGVQIGFCPTCGMFTTPSHTYCEKCGQALKWPEPPKEE